MRSLLLFSSHVLFLLLPLCFSSLDLSHSLQTLFFLPSLNFFNLFLALRVFLLSALFCCYSITFCLLFATQSLCPFSFLLLSLSEDWPQHGYRDPENSARGRIGARGWPQCAGVQPSPVCGVAQCLISYTHTMTRGLEGN